MLVNTVWLSDYLSETGTHDEMLDALMAAGLEVEESHILSDELQRVVVGFVREKQPIADAPGYFACKIEVQPGQLVDIICGSDHPVNVGDGVPVALGGTKLPTMARPLEDRKVKGHLSQGMICADGELGLVTSGSGLQVFTDESAMGTPLPVAIEIRDMLVDVAVLPNRPDFTGYLGIAREIAAILGTEMKYPSGVSIETSSSNAIAVDIQEPELCPRYMARHFTDVKVGPSPNWLKSRLQSVGQRSINNVVDITNFILLEWGQPLHAFDYATLAGQKIEVRLMRKGETLRLLNDVELNADGHLPLVIADAEKPVALAGIMGGSETQTTDETTEIMLEAACFDPVCIRMSARHLGVRSDSSYRFERGTDPNRMLTGAFNRACELLQADDLSQATADDGWEDSYPKTIEPVTISITSNQISRILGTPLSVDDVKSNLSKLDMECIDASADNSLQEDALNITVPSWRRDIDNPVVLAEDIARLIHYDNLEVTPMVATTTFGRANDADRVRQLLANHLVGNGFLECRNPPLTTPNIGGLYSQWPGKFVEVENAITTDMTSLRQSLLGSLSQVVERNFRRGIDTYRFFEIDRTFRKDANSETGIDERWAVAGIMGGTVNSSAWMASDKSIQFLNVKGLVENLLSQVGVHNATFENGVPANGFIEGEIAIIKAGDQVLGCLGRIDVKTVDPKGKIRVPLYGFELDVAALLEQRTEIRRFAGLPRPPAITRDISVAVSTDTEYQDLERSIYSAFNVAVEKLEPESRGDDESIALKPNLERIVCVDQYTGEKLGAGKTSLTIRMVFRDAQHTLTSNEATQLVESVVARLKDEHNADQR